MMIIWGNSYMEIFDKYPELAKKFEMLCLTRRNEILESMLETDSEFKKLCGERADSSMALKNAFGDVKLNVLYEKYSDSVYAQEVYELDAMYKQAFCDALFAIREQGLL